MEAYYGAVDNSGAKVDDQNAYISAHLKSLSIKPLKLTQFIYEEDTKTFYIAPLRMGPFNEKTPIK